MSSVITLTSVHPQMPLKTNAQFQVIGSVITLFDFVLVNGGASVNISSITRSLTTATVVTEAPHQLTIGDKVTHANTGEANFDGIRRVETILNATSYVFICADTGVASTGVTGTSKLSPAGWTKFASSGNTAVYKSANLYDGEALFVQIEDYSASYYKMKIARGLTAINTANIITNESYLTKGLSGTFSFVIFADNKTVLFGLNGTYSYSFGYAKKLNIEDEALTPPTVMCPSNSSTGTVSLANCHTLFGAASNFHTNMTPQTAQIYLLGSESVVSLIGLGVTSLLGTPRSSTTGGSYSTNTSPYELSSIQAGFKGVNTKTGYMPLVSVDIWEKSAESGEILTPNSRARGIYQSYSRMPTDYISSLSEGILRLKMKINGVYKNFVVYNCGSTSILNTQLFVDADSWDD